MQPGRRDGLQRARHRRRRALRPAHAGATAATCRCSAPSRAEALARIPASGRAARLLYETIRRMLSRAGVRRDRRHRGRAATQHAPRRCRCGAPDAAAGPFQRRRCAQKSTQLKRFLLSKSVSPPAGDADHRRGAAGGARAVRGLHGATRRRCRPSYRRAQPSRTRAVADYIAGMTDRFALREHERLTGRARCSPDGNAAALAATQLPWPALPGSPLPGQVHLMVQRGHNGQAVFVDDDGPASATCAALREGGRANTRGAARLRAARRPRCSCWPRRRSRGAEPHDAGRWAGAMWPPSTAAMAAAARCGTGASAPR